MPSSSRPSRALYLTTSCLANCIVFSQGLLSVRRRGSSSLSGDNVNTSGPCTDECPMNAAVFPSFDALTLEIIGASNSLGNSFCSLGPHAMSVRTPIDPEIYIIFAHVTDSICASGDDIDAHS